METSSIFTNLEPTEEASDSASEDSDRICEDSNGLRELEDYLTKAMFGFSILVIFGLGFIVRRKALCLKCCWSRPGIAQPVNFIEETGRRWAYAACFVVLTNNVLLLFNGEQFWDILHTSDTDWMKKYGWVKVLTKLLDALSVCLVFYPLLACIDHRRFIAANVVGFIYSIPNIVMNIVIFHNCPATQYMKELKLEKMMLRIAIFISYFVVGFSYVLDFIINIKRRRERNLEARRKGGFGGFKISHHFEYVANMLQKRENDIEEGKGIKVKLLNTAKRLKYERSFGFRYSTRLIGSLTICITILIWLLIESSELFEDLFLKLNTVCQWSKDVEMLSDMSEMINLICDKIIVARIICHFSMGFSALMIIIMLIHTLITYKRRWHQLLKGDHSWHPFGNTILNPSTIVLNGLKFAGYQVAFVLYGWSILATVVMALLLFLSFAFIIPLIEGVRNSFIDWLIGFWPTALVGMVIIPISQKLICKFIFLQDKGSVMALNNRRMYNAASYYFLILNIIVGIFSCLKRILISFVLGTLFLSRLDQPLMMKGFETKDPGYNAFVSMLIVDLYHNHPVLKAFVELLIQIRQQKSPSADPKDVKAVALQEQNRRSKMLRNRWRKTVTLVNNPSLALKAIEQRLIEERNAKGKLMKPEVHNSDSTNAEPVKKPDEEKSALIDKDNREISGDIEMRAYL